MRFIRTPGFLAMGVIAFGACSDPEQRTDLRPEGPPDVLAITVMSDLFGSLYETAIYCKQNDEKRPGLVGVTDFTTLQVCPDDISQPAENPASALYGAWYVRVVFDELLDPDIEDLVPILDEDGLPTETFCGTIEPTAPVVLRCEILDQTTGNLVMSDIPYDGYYVPNGNAVTWPLGPSLVVQPFFEDNDGNVFDIPPEGHCTVQLKPSIVDKDGIATPDTSAFDFQVAPLQVLDLVPDGEEIGTVDAFWEVIFNAPIDDTTLCNPDCIADPDFEVYRDGTRITDPAEIGVAGFGIGADIFLATLYEPGHSYRLVIPQGMTVVDGVRPTNPTPVRGLTDPAQNANNQIGDFTTADFALVQVRGGAGIPINPIAGFFEMDFNSPMDDTSLADTEWSINDAAGNPVANAFFDPADAGVGVFFFGGDFLAGQTYTFTFNQGAMVQDISSTPNVFTASSPIVQSFTTKAISILTVGPDDPVAISDGPGFFFTFNQAMDCATVTEADFTIAPQPPNVVIDCSPTRVDITADFAVGTTYTFTVNANAMFTSVFNESFTNTAARSVVMPVVADPEPQEPNACLVLNP